MTNLEVFYRHWNLPFWGFIPLMALAGLLLAALLVWSLAWKALALWKAAQNGHKIWFAVLFLVNTAGILEILYIYVFSRRMMKK